MGNLEWASPIDCNFYFPGYADGGMSGDVEGTALPVELYQRMAQLPTMNTPTQRIPRLHMPEDIADGKAEGYPWIGKSIEVFSTKVDFKGDRVDAVRVRIPKEPAADGLVDEPPVRPKRGAPAEEPGKSSAGPVEDLDDEIPF